jgi:hypothetical protein
MSDSDFTKAISKINRETNEGKTKWNSSNSRPQSLPEGEDLSGPVYTCKVLDRFLRLYRFRAKHYFDEDEFAWTENLRLEFIDKNGNAIWTFPYNNATSDLYDTVQYQLANVRGFLEDFLDKEEDNLPF